MLVGKSWKYFQTLHSVRTEFLQTQLNVVVRYTVTVGKSAVPLLSSTKD